MDMPAASPTFPPLQAAALNELKDWLHIATTDADAALAGQLRAALSLCEQFTGRVPIVRAIAEEHGSGGGWHALRHGPVLAIERVEGLLAEGADVALPVDAYAIDIGGEGDGRVRVLRPGAAGRVRVHYSAGLASSWGALPEPLRQGVVRLAAHLYTERGDPGAPPAAVSALWRPWRRVML